MVVCDITVVQIFVLLILFQIKHFFADYPLQNGFMLKKFLPGWGFFFPLAAHCAVHAAMTLAIVMYVNPAMWWLAVVDLVIHFVMDRIKAGPKYLGRFKALSAGEFMERIRWTKAIGIGLETAPEKDRPALAKEMDDKARRDIRDNMFFWWSLGVDQTVHHLTHYFIIFMLLMG